MEDRSLPWVPEPEPDPATRAFARLEGEMALMRRAVEHLATEKAEIDIPDYSNTLGEMAKRLVAIDENPAMQLTPEDMAARMQAAAAQARRDDHIALADAQHQHVEAVRALRGLVGTAASFNEQRRRLKWAASGGLLAGMLLWSFLPGVILRTMPTSWHMPEAMARQIIGEPTLWEAGTRLMRADSPAAWDALSHAAEMLRDNREAIGKCQGAAANGKKPVRCTVEIKPES